MPSETLATSRDIWSWLALSCAMLALSCSISWPAAARSRAIDCSDCISSEDGAAGGATPSAAAWAGAAGCGEAVFAADAGTPAWLACDDDDVGTNCGAHLANIRWA